VLRLRRYEQKSAFCKGVDQCRVPSGCRDFKRFLRTGLLKHVWLSRYHNDGRKTLYIYIYSNYLHRTPISPTTSIRVHVGSQKTCPLTGGLSSAKVIDWPGGLTARMMSVLSVNNLLRDQRLVDVREVQTIVTWAISEMKKNKNKNKTR